MTQGSARVTATEIDLSGPTTVQPTGVPAGVIGTAVKGPAFIPVTVGNISDFYDKFGKTDGKKFGPLAVAAWLGEGAGSATYIRVLGVGDGKERNADGSVNNAGFIVGEQLTTFESLPFGDHIDNPFATVGGAEGRTYFLGAFMSESAGSTVFSSAGLQNGNAACPILRGVVMAASGVILTLASGTIPTPLSSTIIALADSVHLSGSAIGKVDLTGGKQEFTLLLNGHKNTDSHPNFITASFDVRDPSYFAKVFNSDPAKLQESGHYLYSHWDLHPAIAVVTGTLLTAEASEENSPIAFLTTSSIARNTATTFVPNYETFQDRFSNAKSPWVISQRFGGQPVNLFRFHAIDSGVGPSTNYKISIENITPSRDDLNKYGTFDVLVRQFNDSDGAVKAINQFRGLSLDPRSDKYIAKVIGDINVFFDFDREESAQKIERLGNYPPRSNYIRVEMNPDIQSSERIVPDIALPVGFRGIDHLVTSGSAPLADCGVLGGTLASAGILKKVVTPPLPFRQTITTGVGPRKRASNRLYWGVQFEHVTNVSNPNVSNSQNESIASFAKYFPSFATTTATFMTGSNSGQPDSAELGILDADRFCHNMFTLENILVVTGSSGLANDREWSNAVYLRSGSIVSNNTTKTRAFKVDDLSISTNRTFAKFTMIMQGGFDGVNIFEKESSELNNTSVLADMSSNDRGRENGNSVRAYTKALEIMKNVVNADIQLLVVPGIREEYVTTFAAESVRDRFDALYLMDIMQKDNDNNDILKPETEASKVSVTNTINSFKERKLDNSFAAAYFPDVNVRDPSTGTTVTAPPSVSVLGAMALNDRLGHPWFAPAGFTRGGLGNRAISAAIQLNQNDMDKLYDASINPIVKFVNSNGPIVWGQKTLQAAASALDRVNVRRLLIEIRRQVRDIATSILFEPNRAATLARFTASVTPRLQRIQAQAGLERFRVIVDSSTTTQQDIENNTVRGKIFVQPTKSIEFVSLDFVVSNGLEAE